MSDQTTPEAAEQSPAPNIYYKGTKTGGLSYQCKYVPKIVYKLGLIEHPSPDKSSKLCSDGIHMAKSIEALRGMGMAKEEIWECEAGTIYAEDSQKVRVGYCFVKKLIQTGPKPTPPWGSLPTDPLCGREWLEAHYFDHTKEEIESLGMVVTTGRQTITVKSKIKPNDLRTAIKAIATA